MIFWYGIIFFIIFTVFSSLFNAIEENEKEKAYNNRVGRGEPQVVAHFSHLEGIKGVAFGTHLTIKIFVEKKEFLIIHDKEEFILSLHQILQVSYIDWEDTVVVPNDPIVDGMIWGFIGGRPPRYYRPNRLSRERCPRDILPAIKGDQ